jgi:hypothetical protein
LETARSLISTKPPALRQHTLRGERHRPVGVAPKARALKVLRGHASANVTEIYAERNLALAAKVAAEIG